MLSEKSQPQEITFRTSPKFQNYRIGEQISSCQKVGTVRITGMTVPIKR